QLLLEKVGDRELWTKIKDHYFLQTRGRMDQELAMSFFNSVIRKTLPGLAVDEQLMFVHEVPDGPDTRPQSDIFFIYQQDWGLERIFRKMLDDFDFGVPYQDKEGCLRFLLK